MFQIGTLIRLVGDPQQIGSFLDTVEQGGRVFGKVQFPEAIRRIPIDQLEAVPTAAEEPLDFLRSGRFSEPQRLRQVLTHIRLTGRLADMIYSMEASNTEFHAHQFKPVLKMIASPTGGLLIADEVGLGKTIEAGLIWTELRARFDYGRLLVICPKVLCTKWASELSSKFAIDARILTAGELYDLLRDRERANRGFQAICSIQGLQPPRGWDDEASEVYQRPSSRLARFFRDQADEEPLIDFLVIDEAHHLRNPETQRNLLGNLLRPLSHHRAFLSATPIQLRSRDLFSLLTLLDPETFRREADFEDILSANRPLVEAREAALKGRPKGELLRLIDEASRHPLLHGSQQIGALREELERLDERPVHADRARIAGRLEQVNLLASVVNRTRRRDVQELRVVRRVHAHAEPMAPLEREVYDRITMVVQAHAASRDVNAGFLLATPQRMLSSCLPAAVEHWRRRCVDLEVEDEEDIEAEAGQDVGPLVERLAVACATLPDATELARNDSKFCRFHSVLETFLRDHPGEKAVVFSTFRPTLRYLARRLADVGIEAETIHGEIGDRDAVLARFMTDDACRVLLSSEVGSEGLDLQFCRTVINYDLPWNPMRVEQRIGRIDRMGQKAEAISVINLLHADTIDERIYRRLYERLDLCSRALGEFEAVLGDEIRKLTAELLSGRLSAAEQEALIEQTARAVSIKKRDIEELEAEAVTLIAHGDQVLRSIHAAHELNRWIAAGDLARYLHDGFALLFPGSVIRDLGEEDLYEISLTSEARLAYGDWLNNRRLPRGRLERDVGPVLCRLGRPPAQRRRGRSIETIGQTHPLIRFIADLITQTDAPRLRPAVAARLRRADLQIDLPPGRYAVLAMLWRFGGQVDVERLAFAGMSLDRRSLLDDEAAEILTMAAVERGEHWFTADIDLDTEEVASCCEQSLLERLTARFEEERAARQAEQEDRATIQLRNLEHRFREESGRLKDIIDRQRRAGRVRASVIALNERKLRRLEERTEQRRRAIGASRKISSQQEALVAMVAEVLP